MADALPTLPQQALNWQTYGADADNLVAVTLCDFTTYGQYVFNPSGNFRQRGVVFATGLVIDNLLSASTVQVMIGPIVETVPPYTKTTLQLGGTSAPVTVASSQSRIYCTFFFGTYYGTTSGTNYYLAQLAAGLAVETGFISMFAGQTAAIPTGYLLCDGTPVSRSTYSGLFAKIGTIYGAGDGSTTFNLPNFSSRVPIGAGTGSGLSTRALGSTGGAEQVVITAAQMPVHTHAITDNGHTHTLSDPGHNHTLTDPGHNHTLTDPGHNHQIQTYNENGTVATTQATARIQDVNTFRQGYNNVTAGYGYFIGHPYAYDNAGTEHYYQWNLVASNTGITIASAKSGVTLASATAGITVQTATTGISLATAGGQAGTTQPTPTVPPYAAVNFVIKT